MRSSSFSKAIISWHLEHQRDLPWKRTKDPYKIWLSEIILQQTRVEQGRPYYEKFISLFPTVQDLAIADHDAVMKAWEGLGYYNRANNLHFTAKIISEQLGGVFPKDYESIISLKGIGPYTASAIASFAFGLSYPVIDGNVLRFISRYTASTLPIDQPEAYKVILSFLNKNILGTDPAFFNQALMDMGAIICTPKNPSCEFCPVNNYCQARAKFMVNDLPIKSKSVNVNSRFIHYFIIKDIKNNCLIKKRPKGDIWQGLYDFPSLEGKSTSKLSQKQVVKEVEKLLQLSFEVISYHKMEEKKHVLTHQHIFPTFHILSINQNIELRELDYYLVMTKKLTNFAFPKMIQKILKNIINT